MAQCQLAVILPCDVSGLMHQQFIPVLKCLFQLTRSLVSMCSGLAGLGVAIISFKQYVQQGYRFVYFTEGRQIISQQTLTISIVWL